MGQLLVVAHHTDICPSLCYGPELIPEPLCSIMRHNDVVQVAMALGSDLDETYYSLNCLGKVKASPKAGPWDQYLRAY